MGCGSSNTDNQAPAISEAELTDAKTNTKFTEEEIKTWYESFMYEHPDGQMDMNGFMKLYSGLYPKGDVKDFTKVLFSAYDTDGSGKIDFSEFIKTMNLASKGSQDEKLTWAFNLYDVDKSGHITKPEAVAVITAIYKMQGVDEDGNEFFLSPREAVDAVWGSLEKDSDGKLSHKEFVIGSKLHPKIRKMLESI